MTDDDLTSLRVKIEGFVQVDAGAALELQGTIDNKGGTIELDQDGVGREELADQLLPQGAGRGLFGGAVGGGDEPGREGGVIKVGHRVCG